MIMENGTAVLARRELNDTAPTTAIQPAAYSFADLKSMADVVAKSNLFGCKTPEQALTMMLLAQAEGLHPIQAARMYHVIEGKPAMRADAMLAKFQQRGGSIRWIEREDDACEAEFTYESAGSIR